ncbi:MAG: hypothetical protein ACE5DN_06605, partial [Flavobacteriales bacterium]
GATVYSQRDLDGSESIQPNEIISSVTPSGEEDEILDYYENYEKVSMGFWNVTIREMPTENEVENIKQLVAVQVKEFTSEMKVQLKEKLALIESELSEGKIIPDRAEIERENARKMFEQALADKKEELLSAAYEEITKISQVVISDEEYKIMVKNEELSKNIVSAVKFNESRIKVTVSVCDDTFLYEYYIDSKYYPIVPIPYTHTGTPYPMSAVLPMIGKQQEINKAHQIMIHNANLASNIRWIYQEGAINETEWEDTSTVPGARLKYRSGFDAPVPVLPAPINNAFYTITEEGKTDIEYIAGIYSSMMGNAKEQPETYKGLLANDEYGTRRIKAWMNTVIEPCLEHLGRVFKDYAQKSYTIEKVFRIVQPQAGAEPVEQRINIPIYNDYGEVIGKWKDYASANFDVRIIAGATLPLNRWALIEEYFKWFQAGLIDDIAMLAETDIRNKERIVERNSLYSKLSNQNSQQEEKIKDLEGTVDTLKRQLIGAGIKHEVEVGSKEITNATLETKQQQKLIRGIMQTELNQFRDKMEQSFNLMKKEFELLKKEKKSS